MRKFCVPISTLKLCQRWGFRKTRACWLGAPGMGCEMQDRLLHYAVRDHFFDHDFKQGMFSTCVFAHRSKFLLYFVHGDDYVGLGVRGDLEGYKENCLNGSSSRIEESWAPTACTRYEF